jgi:hypothetical protein
VRVLASDGGQMQTQVDAIWQKRLVLEKMFSTPPCDPSIAINPRQIPIQLPD